jgi:hypothetical protein
LLAKEYWVSVFASKAGDREKILIFEHVPPVDQVPIIISVDPHTVLISIA